MAGHPVKKTITVKTSDPNHPELKLTFTGQVKPVAELSDSIARLTGNTGQTISKTITIRPVPENPFNIKTVKAENSHDFRFELVTKKEPGAGITHYLTVYNCKQQKGWYTGKIIIKTDSDVSPVLEIRVMGFIRGE